MFTTLNDQLPEIGEEEMGIEIVGVGLEGARGGIGGVWGVGVEGDFLGLGPDDDGVGLTVTVGLEVTVDVSLVP